MSQFEKGYKAAAVIPQMPSSRGSTVTFSRGLCAESADCIYSPFLLESCALPVERSNYNHQIPHKAACEIDYRKVIVLAAFAE